MPRTAGIKRDRIQLRLDAKGEAAARFYARYGFQAFPTHPLRLFLPVETIAQSGL